MKGEPNSPIWPVTMAVSVVAQPTGGSVIGLADGSGYLQPWLGALPQMWVGQCWHPAAQPDSFLITPK